jgi:diguanylate cyclase (GGDEF)-like protein
LALVNPPPSSAKGDWVKWFALAGIAAGLLLAGSGICIRQLADVPSYWLVFSSVAAFTWLFLLIRFRVFSKSHHLLVLVGTVVGFNLLAQSTGGEQSPLIFGIFLLMGIAAWEGEAKYGYLVAILFSVLEAFYLRKEDAPEGLSLYLRWAAYLISAVFLARVVKTRREKEQLNLRLESLKNDADQLAFEAEPSSFNVPKDRLLMEESRLSARVGTVMELEGVLGRQLTLFQKSISVHTAIFFLWTSVEEKKVLRLRAASSLSKDIATDITLLPGETLVGLAAKEGRRVLLNDIATDSSKALPYYLKPQPIGSFLAQPIFLKSAQQEEGAGEDRELVGVLILDHEKPNYFQERELALVEQFSEMLADTVQNTRILHFSRTKTRNLHALYEVSNSFSSLLDLDQVLKTALATAREISSCDSAYVALTEGEGHKFSVRAWWGHASVEKPIYLEDELAAWIWENKKPIRYTRGQKEKGLVSFAKREGMLGSTQSFLMVPLMAGEDILGVIRLNSQKPATYQAYDQDVLTTLANQTAMAVENALMVRQIRDMAIRDGLTGIYNHRYFQERLMEEMTKAERYNKDLSLALLDVDHFKKFNDSYGHQEGDRVLRVVAELIQGTVRHKIDTVARYGGEEFAVILPESDGNTGKELAERIRKNIESYLFENDGKNPYRVTVSVGIASYPFDAREPRVLIQTADQALYEAKKAGRNRVKRFSTEGTTLKSP